MALLGTAADRRETLLRRSTRSIARRWRWGSAAIRGDAITLDGQHDPRETDTSSRSCSWRASTVYRATASFEADGKSYAGGTFVIPMAQVFARYVRDILEKTDLPRSAPLA